MKQTFETRLGMNTVIGGLSADYFNFYCEKCGEPVKIRFLGYDPAVPRFESICKCGEVHRFKSEISDIPRK